MLQEAFDIVYTAALGAFNVFQRIFARLDAVGYLVIIFFVATVISLLIVPLRGGSLVTSGSSDVVVTQTTTQTYNHKTKKFSPKKTTVTESRRGKRK